MKHKGNEADYIDIGKIVNTHGHRGEVRVIPLTDDPKRMEELETLFFSLNGQIQQLTINSVRYHKNFVILGFDEIRDMNAAQSLKNGLLRITKDQLRELPEGRYYIFDIIGLNVVTVDGRRLGRVTDVFQTGANDVYEVKDDVSGKIYLIPAIKQTVKTIDLENKEMVIEPLEGLLD